MKNGNWTKINYLARILMLFQRLSSCEPEAIQNIMNELGTKRVLLHYVKGNGQHPSTNAYNEEEDDF